jgi:hypothetical protein
VFWTLYITRFQLNVTAVPQLRWLVTGFPTVVAQVPSQVRSCEVRGGRSGAAASFLRVLRFPLPIFLPPNAPYLSVILGWYNRPISGRLSSGLSLIPPDENNIKKLNFTSKIATKISES